MLVFLWISTLLFPLASSNSIFKNEVPGRRSPNIVYKIGDLSESPTVTPESIKDALRLIQENTCVNFIDSGKAAGKTVDFVIQNAPGNPWSCRISNNVFEIGDCISSRTVMIHEVGHFLGMCHTQNRNDWRQYISVLPNSYGVESFDDANCKSVPVPEWKYDYGSVMHSTDQAIVSKPIKDGYAGTFTQGVRASFTDYRTINWLFNCSGKCATQPKCQNGGYTHPRNCKKCMCNKYYTGDLCEKPRNLVKLSCAGKKSFVKEIRVTSTNEEQKKNRKLMDDFFNRGEDLWYIIEATKGTQIKVEVRSWATRGTPLPATRCALYAVEINDGDKNMVGKMFCDSWALGTVWHNFTAQSNSLGLHMEYAAETPTTLFAQFSLLGC